MGEDNLSKQDSLDERYILMPHNHRLAWFFQHKSKCIGEYIPFISWKYIHNGTMAVQKSEACPRAESPVQIDTLQPPLFL
jgi:hypothetical protein